jgi:hypothetical protein
MRRIFRKIKEKITRKMTSETKKAARQPQREPRIKMHQDVKVEQAKFYTAPQVTKKYPVFQQDLPSSYGQDKIVLQARDPWWIHSYWELTSNTIERLKQELKEVFYQSRRVLRVYDVSHISFDGKNAHRYFDIEIDDQATNWYIDTGGPGRSWCVDFGLKLPDGRFITIMRSNTVHTPLDGPSWITDEEWMIPEDTFARLYGIGVGLGMSSPVGKGWQEKVKKRFWQPAASMGVSSLFSPVKRVPLQKGFWLVVNTELIVYGATEPDAKVTVAGKPVNLRPDGTFSLRFSLPDGKQVIPVKAVSSDRVHEKTITPIVTRETK